MNKSLVALLVVATCYTETNHSAALSKTTAAATISEGLGQGATQHSSATSHDSTAEQSLKLASKILNKSLQILAKHMGGFKQLTFNAKPSQISNFDHHYFSAFIVVKKKPSLGIFIWNPDNNSFWTFRLEGFNELAEVYFSSDYSKLFAAVRKPNSQELHHLILSEDTDATCLEEVSPPNDTSTT